MPSTTLKENVVVHDFVRRFLIEGLCGLYESIENKRDEGKTKREKETKDSKGKGKEEKIEKK